MLSGLVFSVSCVSCSGAVPSQSGPGEVKSYIVQFVQQYMDSPGRGGCVLYLCGVVTVYPWLLSDSRPNDRLHIEQLGAVSPYEFLSSIHPLPAEHGEHTHNNTVLGLKCAMISTLAWLHVNKCNWVDGT